MLFKSNSKVTSVDTVSETDYEAYEPYGDLYYDESGGEEVPTSKWGNFIDSFKKFEMDEIDPRLTDAEKAIVATSTSPLSKQLKSRHIQMIAIGSAVGTGLFIGSGGALAQGGPGSVMIAWGLVGMMVFCTVQALGELATIFPVPGASFTYMSRFIDKSWGFAMGWNYIMQWLVVLPLELVSSSMVMSYWKTNVSSVVWVAIFLVVILSINFFGVKGYGEAEFILSTIKLIGIIGFIIFGIVIICGGGPTHQHFGAGFWHHPGAFKNAQKGLASVAVTATFSFNGSELLGMTAAESENPRKAIPKATKQVFWRIICFYMLSLFVITCLVPSNDLRLVIESHTQSSPFVLAIRNAGVKGLPSVMNVIILISVLSVANSSVYAGSRIIAAMANLQMAPQILAYIDRRGRPLVGIAISGAFGLLCFLVKADDGSQVFQWLISLTGISCMFTWGSICLCHIRFRYTLQAQGRSTDELPFAAMTGIWGSYFGILMNFLALMCQFWIAIYPIDHASSASYFFKAYLCFPVVIIFFVAHKLYSKDWRFYIPIDEIDVDFGRREFDIEFLKQEIREEKEYLRSRPFYIRWYHVWC